MRSREGQKWDKGAGVMLGDGPRARVFPGDICWLPSDCDFLKSVKEPAQSQCGFSC